MSTLSQTHKIVQALLFAAREPLTPEQVNICMQEQVDLAAVVADLNYYFEAENQPVWIQPLAEGYRLMTRSEYEPWISRLFQNKGKLKLSRSALETLAIIAYKQPVTRVEIDTIRGVTTVLRPLIEKGLITINGRQDGPGRPLLYGTTARFLEYFGLTSLRDLPRVKELEEIVADEKPDPGQANHAIE